MLEQQIGYCIIEDLKWFRGYIEFTIPQHSGGLVWKTFTAVMPTEESARKMILEFLIKIKQGNVEVIEFAKRKEVKNGDPILL